MCVEASQIDAGFWELMTRERGMDWGVELLMKFPFSYY